MNSSILSNVGQALGAYYAKSYNRDVPFIVGAIFSHFSESDTEYTDARFQRWLATQAEATKNASTSEKLRSYYAQSYGQPEDIIEEKVLVYFAEADTEFSRDAFGKFFEQEFLTQHPEITHPQDLRVKLATLLPETTVSSGIIAPGCPFLNAIQNLPRERAETDEVVASFEEKIRNYRCPGYNGDPDKALRGVHPKSYGVVQATFRIIDENSTPLDPKIAVLPQKNRIGVFAQIGAAFASKMRFSGSGGMPFEVLDDTYARQSHGLALKLIQDNGQTLHDFLLNNAPIFPSKEPRSAIPQQEDTLDEGTLKLMDDVLARASDPGQPLFMEQFSISAYAWGNQQSVKYSVRPPADLKIQLKPEDQKVYDQILSGRDSNFRSEVLLFLLQKIQKPIELSFCVQFSDPNHASGNGCPIDDETIEWQTPWYQVATIQVDPQDIGNQDDEDLVFNSYQISSAEHLPIGRLNRARLWAYTESARTRHQENQVGAAPHPYEQPDDLNIAVVGGGASGLCAALALSEFGYRVTVYEKRQSLGGHATSRSVHDGKHVRDPAFGAFRKRQWPNFWALLKTLDVDPISLGQCDDWFNSPFLGWFHEDGSPLERSPAVMEEGRTFATALSKALRDPEADGKTVGELVDELQLSDAFVNTWFMGGVILYFGGHPTQHYLNYPLRLIAWMWQNSIAEETTEPLELFRVKDSEYINALADFLTSRGVTIETGVEVSVAERNHERVTLDVAGEHKTFGEVILAVQPQCSVKVLGEHASTEERETLGAFEYSVDTVAVHQDESYMPTDKSLWKLANIRLPNSTEPHATRSQTLPYTLCAPCNLDDATPILATYDYAHIDHWPDSADLFTFSHAVVTPRTQRLRQQLETLQGKAGIHYCGSWSRGLTLHEDAVVTGFEAANRILDSKGEYKLLSPPTPMPKPFEALDEELLETDGDLSAGIPAIETTLKDIIHSVMGIDTAELDGDTDVQALGMSSLHFAKLANTINANLPPTAEDEVDITMLLQMETLFEVAEYIHEAVHGQGATEASAPTDQAHRVQPAEPSAAKPKPKFKTKSRRAFIEALDDQREREAAIPMAKVMGIQGLGIAGLFAAIALSANLAFWVGTQFYGSGGIQNILMALPAAWSTYCLAYSAIAICVKWAVVGKLKPGRYSVYRKTHLKWWTANLFLNFGQQSIWLAFRDSHLGLWLLQLLGAKVHSGATLNIDGLNPAVSLVDADLLNIGDRAYIRRGALVQCHIFTEGSFILAPITLEERTVIWTRGVVEPGCTIEKTGILEHHSVLTMGNTLPTGMRAHGVPATKIDSHREDGVKAGSGVDKLIHTLMGFIALPYMMAGAFGLFYLVIQTMVDNPSLYSFDWRVWVSLWPAFIITTIILGAICCLIKWVLIGKLKPGQLESDLSVRLSVVKFVSFLMMRFALFCPRDLRWMLVRGMGGNVAYGSVTDCPLVEVAYADLLTMEENSFYSPAAYADFAAFRNGQIVLEEVRLESTAYVGAYSTVSAPIRLPPLSLLASTSTLATGTQVESSQVWVGSPAKCVPISLGEVSDDSHSLDGWSLLKNRVIDLSNHYFVVLLMSSVALIGYHLFADILWPREGSVDLLLRTLASFGFILFSYGATTFGMLPLLRLDTELLRWLCIKDEEIRTKGFERSTWKFNVWHLLSNHLLPYGLITDLYAGTPLQLWLARRLGATIGENVYLANGVGIREFTFTHIHDGVMLNRGSAMIAHSELPNGRIIMKDINLYPGSSMGFISYIVGGTDLPEGALLGSLSRPFDSQELDPGGEYDNTPCKRRER